MLRVVGSSLSLTINENITNEDCINIINNICFFKENAKKY